LLIKNNLITKINIMKNQVLKIMADVFKINVTEIPDNVKPGMIEQWDSLRHLLLIVKIEEEFNFRFTDNELIELKDLNSIIGTINFKLNK
jgi:acyl carrier protein